MENHSLIVCFVNANDKITLKYLDKDNNDPEATAELISLNPDDIINIAKSLSAALDDYYENYTDSQV